MQCHREKRAKAFASMAREKPRQRTFGLLAVAALALIAHEASAAAPLVPLDRNPTEILSRDWLQGNVAAPGRRITTKSIFLVPERGETFSRDCPEGTWRSGGRCVPFLHLDEAARVQLLLDRLNVQFGTVASSGQNSDEGYDYEETIPEAQGPLQVNIPLSPELIGPTPPRAITPEPALHDKVIPTPFNDAVSMDNEGNSKIQNATKFQDHPTLVDELESLKDGVKDTNNMNPIDSIVSMDGNIAITDSYVIGASEAGVSTENIKMQINDNIQSEQNSSSVAIKPEETILGNAAHSTNNTSSIDTSVKSDNTAEAETLTSKMTSEKSSYIKNKIKDKIKYDEHLRNKLRPELDYSDLSEAIKIISRFAEITTDDIFKEKNSSRDPYYNEREENPLGTRTKLEHLKKFSRYNKSATETQIKVEPPEKIESNVNPLLKLTPNQMESMEIDMKREIKESLQIRDEQESHLNHGVSREDPRDFARHQRVVSRNPIRHRRLYPRTRRPGHVSYFLA